MNLQEEIKREKARCLVEANGGISLPASGMIYWLALGIAGFFLNKAMWTYGAMYTSGLILPLGFLLSKPLKANLKVKSPLSSIIFPAFVGMGLSFSVTIAVIYANINLVPLAFSVGMTLHWPAIGWMYGSRVCLIHAIARTAAVTFCYFAFPEYNFTLIPFVVALAYFVTIFGLKMEVKAAKEQYAF